MTLNDIFQKLLDTYSYQGWWPITDYDGSNPTKTGSTHIRQVLFIPLLKIMA